MMGSEPVAMSTSAFGHGDPEKSKGSTQPLRVLMDARIHRAFRTGLGRYIEQLSLALSRREDAVVTLAVERGSSGETFARTHGLGTHLVGRQRLPLWLGGKDFDVFHVTYPIIAPAFGVPSVVTVHDLIYDDPRWAGLAKRSAFRLITGTLLSRADGIIADSRAIADQIERKRGTRPPITVAPLGVRTLPGERQSRPRANEFLYLGSLRRHKGIEVALNAMREAPQARLTVLSSEAVERWPGLVADLDDSVRARISFIPYADDAVRDAILTRSVALVVPSHAEGFGLPVLEALGVGKPVLCSDIAVFREVAGAHATYFRAGDHVALARVMESTSGNAGDAVSEEGRRHAEQYTWERCAELSKRAYLAAVT